MSLTPDKLEQFAVELANASDAAIVAQKIIAALSEPFEVSGQEIVITASIGIATYPADGQDAGVDAPEIAVKTVLP